MCDVFIGLYRRLKYFDIRTEVYKLVCIRYNNKNCSTTQQLDISLFVPVD